MPPCQDLIYEILQLFSHFLEKCILASINLDHSLLYIRPQSNLTRDAVEDG